jgi:hypothetical protein
MSAVVLDVVQPARVLGSIEQSFKPALHMLF